MGIDVSPQYSEPEKIGDATWLEPLVRRRYTEDIPVQRLDT